LKRRGVFLGMRWRAGFGNCDDLPAPDEPRPTQPRLRDRARRRSGQRAVAYYEIIAPPSEYYYGYCAACTMQKVTLNADGMETVSDLVGRAAMSVGNTEQILHLARVEVGYAPRRESSPAMRSCSNAATTPGELRAGDWRCSKIEIEMVGAETSEARLASAGDAISRHSLDSTWRPGIYGRADSAIA